MGMQIWCSSLLLLPILTLSPICLPSLIEMRTLSKTTGSAGVLHSVFPFCYNWFLFGNMSNSLLCNSTYSSHMENMWVVFFFLETESTLFSGWPQTMGLKLFSLPEQLGHRQAPLQLSCQSHYVIFLPLSLMPTIVLVEMPLSFHLVQISPFCEIRIKFYPVYKIFSHSTLGYKYSPNPCNIAPGYPSTL